MAFTDEQNRRLAQHAAANRVRALIRLEQAMLEAAVALASLDNHTPFQHPAKGWIAAVRQAVYADKDGGANQGGTLFTLHDNLELVSRLE